jgi:hypothetical protein
MLDKVGTEIPLHLRHVFTRNVLEVLISDYETLNNRIADKVDCKDYQFIDICIPTFEAICSDMKNLLKAQIPYAVCDWCDGVGCEHCKGKGWLGKFMFDMTQRKE